MHQEAIANGQQAVAMRPQSAYSHFALGFAYYQKGKPEYRNSLNEFERALALRDDALDEQLKFSIQQKLVIVKKTLGIKN
jgi:tetratricopeptide (TPR) repeat protein